MNTKSCVQILFLRESKDQNSGWRIMPCQQAETKKLKTKRKKKETKKETETKQSDSVTGPPHVPSSFSFGTFFFHPSPSSQDKSVVLGHQSAHPSPDRRPAHFGTAGRSNTTPSLRLLSREMLFATHRTPSRSSKDSISEIFLRRKILFLPPSPPLFSRVAPLYT